MSESDHQHSLKHYALKTTASMLFSQPGFLSIRIRDAMTKWFISASLPSAPSLSGGTNASSTIVGGGGNTIHGVQLVKDIFLNLTVAVLFREVINKEKLENLFQSWFQMNISWPIGGIGGLSLPTAWSKGQKSMVELETFLWTEIKQRLYSDKGYGNDLIGCYLYASEKVNQLTTNLNSTSTNPSPSISTTSLSGIDLEKTILSDCFTFVDSFCNNIACACIWFLVCLEQAPGIKQVLITEIRNYHYDLEISTIQSTTILPYLSATIEETLRIYGFFHKNSLKRITLYDLEYEEYIIPKGIPIHLPLYSLNFNEDYFPLSTIFDPLRFMSGGVNHETDGNFSFGLGHHMCPGAMLARSVMMVFAFTLLEGFDIVGKVDQSFEPIFQKVFFSSSSAMVSFPYPADGLIYTSITSRPTRVETMLRSR
jgi:cytochrome P450